MSRYRYYYKSIHISQTTSSLTHIMANIPSIDTSHRELQTHDENVDHWVTKCSMCGAPANPFSEHCSDCSKKRSVQEFFSVPEPELRVESTHRFCNYIHARGPKQGLPCGRPVVFPYQYCDNCLQQKSHGPLVFAPEQKRHCSQL